MLSTGNTARRRARVGVFRMIRLLERELYVLYVPLFG